ncbi:MAG: LysM peptidoglycan-binding domain-containing protein [Propionibacteriaceae bacterium]|nr:LysM peptidoglycan-binding domain-containing protein [Propionibacteriaceae bacterium]
MRWLRGLGALAALCLVLVGAPMALAAWGRVPVGWPAALARPDDGAVLLVGLTAVGWVAWAAFTASTVAEAVRLLSAGKLRFRIPLLAGLQQVSTLLLLAVLALAPGRPGGAQSLPARVVAAQPQPQSEPEPESPTAAEPAPDTMVVAPGDDLWTVSERLLGDGARWREVAAANPVQLADPTRPLVPGSRLALPAGAAEHALRVRVERGDTLSGLALDHLGAAGRWPRIAAANSELIEDPDHIEVGWRLVVPGADEAARTSPPEPEGAEPEPEAPATPSPEPTEPGPAPSPPGPRGDSGPDAGTSAPAVPGAGAQASEQPLPGEPQEPDVQLAPLLGTIGTLAAAAIVGTLEARRFLRLRERPVGRRLIPPDDRAARLRAAIGVRQRPDRLAGLDAALRLIGEHSFAAGLPLPDLERIEVAEDRIVFHLAGPAGEPPAGFTAGASGWTVQLSDWEPRPSAHPCPYPAVVSLGTTTTGELVLVDAERSRVLAVAAEASELVSSTLASIGVELACAPWAQEVRVVAVGAGTELVALAGGERVQRQARAEDAVAQAHLLVSQRRAALGSEALSALRVDPDRADAVAPVVFVFTEDVGQEVAAELDELLSGDASGIVAILASTADAAAHWVVSGDPYAPVGRLAGRPGRLQAHGIPEAARTGVAALFRTAADPATAPAPWWSGDDHNVVALPQTARRGEEPVDVVRLVPSTHPQVWLIGPTDLHGATGPEPTRSRQQLVELCAWLLEHPGSTATAMAAALAVAEGTRRSNLSRLRTWLGDDNDGQPYLPDAYSGRILLHAAVTSDWQRLQLLLSPGIDRVGDSTLIAALELVRGAPLADAAPGQWHWAEELRTDISSALRDVGVTLTDHALARGDIDLARWAAARALVVAPEDELLLCARIRTEHRAGNRVDVERLVNQVTRQARMLGVDLLPETVELCQQVVEGRIRARRA